MMICIPANAAARIGVRPVAGQIDLSEVRGPRAVRLIREVYVDPDDGRLAAREFNAYKKAAFEAANRVDNDAWRALRGLICRTTGDCFDKCDPALRAGCSLCSATDRYLEARSRAWETFHRLCALKLAELVDRAIRRGAAMPGFHCVTADGCGMQLPATPPVAPDPWEVLTG